ncbi:MAG: glycosyltransferase family 2 protein [Candidatus Bathyarchaeia archaeon]
MGELWIKNKNENTAVRDFPKVSVIILNLNGMKLLQKTLPMLLKTNYPDMEVIVVDNGSCDGSVSYLKQNCPSVTVMSLKENVGITIGNNIGASVANGKYLAFINNDMEVDSEWLTPLVMALEADSSIGCCDSKYLNYFERNKFDVSCGAGRFMDKFGNCLNRGGGQVDTGQFDCRQEVFHGMAIFRKDLFAKAGGYDASFFAYFDETDLCWRLHRMGYKIVYIPESIIYHMGSATSSVSSAKKKKMKKPIAFHFYKNRLRMLIKNQFGFSLIISVSGYLLDAVGLGLNFLLSGDRDYVGVLGKAVFWNLKNLGGTLQNRHNFKCVSDDFKSLFLPYSGIWIVNVKALTKRM